MLNNIKRDIMNKKLVVLITVLVILSQVAYAQEYVFRVLASNGVNLVKIEGDDWQVLKTGAKLYSGYDIKLTENGYLGLLHSSGKTIELKEDSTYNISNLSLELLSNSQNMVSKYAEYVMSKMTPEQKEENRRLYAGVTGSVERSIISSDIFIYLPKTVSVLNDKAIIRWSSTVKKPIYIVTIRDVFGEVILQLETAENFYELNFYDEYFANGMISNLIIIQVTQKENKKVASQSVSIRKLIRSNAQDILSGLKQLETSVGGESSLNNLILAEFYEENKLILDAITSYENAIKLSPEIEYFQKVYAEFLIRNGFKNPDDVDSNEK